MIIDALTHVNPNPKAFGDRYDASVEFLIKNLEESPVDRAVVTAIAADTYYGTSNEFVIECCRKYPDRLIGVASVDPLRDPDAVATLERCVREGGMRGLKLHPRHQKLSVADPAVFPVVEKAAELGVPVWICGSQWRNAPLKFQMPIHVDDLCKAVPEAKIIIAHAGGFLFLQALMVAVANPNVYLETSTDLKYFYGTPFEDQLMFVLKQVGARRVIYGSDHPEYAVKE
ncbi:MAG: amidohydrolase family protein, partial [Candidatus Hydrogenedentales bacterium]